MTLTSRTRLGSYEILGPLGAGGMGEVYRAKDIRLGREVAIKVLPVDVAASPDRLARFEREARTVASLNHPSIVTLFSIEDADGIRFLTMELVEGQTLSSLVATGGLPLAKLLELAIPLTDALAVAHDKGVIHRDLKPGNVMVTGEGRVKVLDFGLARMVGQEGPRPEPTLETTASGPTSAEGQVFGTAPYMAPEQIRGDAVDARSDLFSLGVILYELATGLRPFTGASPADVSSSILRDTPLPVQTLRGDLPRDLDRIIGRCLEKNIRDRVQTARDVHQELRQLGQEAERTAGLPAPTRARAALPRTPLDRASIAVLPFANLSGDTGDEYFADGIVEEIVTGLSRIKWLFVISRNSTLIYRGRPIDVKAIGRDLDVRYVLQGSVRRSANHVRVTGQLVDTKTAVTIWAERYDGTLVDIFALQDEITMSVIGAVEPSLRKAEVERARRKRPGNLDAYDLFLRALPLATTAMPEDADKALQLLQEAIRLEPSYAAVHGFIAWCHEQRYLRGGLHANTRDAALEHAHAAIETGSDDAMALAMGGFVVGVLERDYETALGAIDRSLALSPSSALAFGFSSIIRAWKGDDSIAIEHAKLGIRLSPYDPLIYLPYVGLAYSYLFIGNFNEAATAAGRASAANPRFSMPRILHVAALVRLGRLEEAKAMADVVLTLQPRFTISGLVSGNITTPERMEMLAEALRQAGLPEQA